MTALKLCLLCIVASSAVIFGFFLLNVDEARWLQSFFGYYFCLALVSCVGISLWQERKGLQAYLQKLNRSTWLCVLVLSCLATYVSLLHEPFMMRVLNDEPGHLAIARAMAEERAVFSPQAGFVEAGEYIKASPSSIYRMYAYPFVISVLHNLSGFRLRNGFIVNAIAALALYIAIFLLGRVIGGCNFAGYCAQALLLTSPLLPQVANSAAYDLFNLSVLAAFALSCLYYSKQLGGAVGGMNLCLSLGLLLSYSRNESILFLSIFMAIFLWKCWRDRSIELTWLAAVSPVFLIVPFAGRVLAKHLSASYDVIYDLADAGFFGLNYMRVNIPDCWEWAFSLNSSDLNAFLISVLFVSVVPVAWILFGRGRWRLLQQKRSKRPSEAGCSPAEVGTFRLEDWVLLGFVFIICVQNIIILTLQWSPVDMAAIRFFLPTNLFLILAIIWGVRTIERKLPSLADGRLFKSLAMLAITFFWVVTMPKAARAELTYQNATATYADWAVNWVAEHDDGRTLYVVRSTALFTLYEIPCVGLDYFRRNYQKISELVAWDFYDSVTVVDLSFYDPDVNAWRGPAPYIELPAEIIMEPLGRHRGFIHGQLSFLRVLGWQETDGTVTSVGAKEAKPQFESEWELFQYILTLRGGARGAVE
jgi:hypothetical protein